MSTYEVRCVKSRIPPKYTMAANSSLFKVDEAFWFYVDTCLVTGALMPVCRAWLSLHPLFSAFPLLGAYLLATYTYKCMRLLTRLYNMEWNDGMENGMEQWTCEVAANSCNWRFSLQVELPSVSLGLLSHHRSFMSNLSTALPTIMLLSVQAWYRCWFIIRCFVIVVLQSQTLTQKVRVWLHKTILLWNSFHG